MDERLALLVMDYQAKRYTRRQFVRKALKLGVAATILTPVLEMAGDRAPRRSPPEAEAAATPPTLVVGIPETVTNIDPVILGTVGYGDKKVADNNINEGIVRFKSGTVDLEPCLARSWDISLDGLTYTFHLRPAFFHDGTPVTAEAVQLNYDRQIDEKNPFHFPGIVYTEVVFGTVSKVEAVDSRTLRITQKRPAVTLLPNLALFAEGIVSPTALQKYGKDYAMYPTASGPFRFERWTRGVEFVEAAYDRYWGGQPRLGRLIWKTVPDDIVRLEQLRSGGIDVATQLSFKDAESLRSNKGFKVVSGTFLATQYLILNGRKPPFNKPEAVQAFQFAINKQNIERAIFFGKYTTGAGPIPPGVLGYDRSLGAVYRYDPARAKALLQKADVAEGSRITLLHKTFGFWPDEAQLIQADLQAIGLKVNLEALDNAAFNAKLNAGEHEVALNNWVMDTGDPDNIMFSVFSSNRARARMGYDNPEVNQLNQTATTERDPSRRQGLYSKVQRLVMETAPFVTLGYEQSVMGAKESVEGLKIAPLGDLPMRDVWVR